MVSTIFAVQTYASAIPTVNNKSRRIQHSLRMSDSPRTCRSYAGDASFPTFSKRYNTLTSQNIGTRLLSPHCSAGTRFFQQQSRLNWKPHHGGLATTAPLMLVRHHDFACPYIGRWLYLNDHASS
jgi:hypothetical protein